MTDKERRLVDDALDWYRFTTIDLVDLDHHTRVVANLERACRAVLAERQAPPTTLPILRESPDGPILDGFDPRTGKRTGW